MIPIILEISEKPLVSIVIASYNYCAYLKEWVESALNQTYKETEIIVVDDGSTDNSTDIISSFGKQIISVIKENGGQASVFNKGFEISQGEIICFIDSDDILYPLAIEKAVEKFRKQNVVKVHWPLAIINKDGKFTGKVMHESDLSEGDLSELVLKKGTDGYNWPCTSGNAWHKNFIKQVYPIPEEVYKKGPDTYLSTIVPLFGNIAKISSAQGAYRIHGANNTFNRPFEERLNYSIERWNYAFDTLASFCNKLEKPNNRPEWERNSWWHKVYYSLKDIEDTLLTYTKFILLDEDEWACGGKVASKIAYPFIEKNGIYFGSPADDESAIKELERLRNNGAQALVVAWPAFWWLDYYGKFLNYLNKNFNSILQNERVIIFDFNRKIDVAT